MKNKKIAIKLEHITKKFGKVTALDDASLTLFKGEILAILGENGSGKTSLMNVLAGIYFPDEGTLEVNGRPATIHSPSDANKYHIGMVHQHFKLVDVFSGIDNILLGYKDEPYPFKNEWKKINARRRAERALKRSRLRSLLHFIPQYLEVLYKKFIDDIGVMKKDRVRTANNIAKRYGFRVDLKKRVSEMSVSEKQTVEIIKTLYRGANVLILDEPTAVLTPQEITHFFSVLKKMKRDNKSIIIITHKLNEVMEVSDRVTIMRKGKYIDSVNTSSTNEKELTNLMVGRKISLNIKRSKCENVSPRLYVTDLNYTDREGNKKLNNISFTANGGEILGVAGIAGSGQKELLLVLSGIEDCDSGAMVYYHPKKNKPVTLFHKTVKNVIKMSKANMFHWYDTGKPVSFDGMRRKEIQAHIDDGHVIFNDDEIMNVRGLSPKEMKDLGIRSNFVPEDRLGMGLVANMNIIQNMMLRNYRKGHYGILNQDIPTKLSREIIKELEVKTPSLRTQVSKLSGGNIQKLLVGREIAASPFVLTAAYPVRGLDINSSYAIYDLLNKQKEKGCAVIFVGEDVDVMLELCDRIIVMNNGRITGEVDARKSNKEEVGLLMTKNMDVIEGGAQ